MSEERIDDRLEKLEKHTHRLSDIAEYLVTLKYAKARDHRDEVADFSEVFDKNSEEVFTVLHSRHATAPAAAAPLPAAAPCPCSKPSSSELKPAKLQHDASTSAFWTWKKQFKAYFDSAQLGTLPCSQQQAYLNNCLDNVLRACVDREATTMIPMYTPIMGLFTFISILHNAFLESYPIHVRRKQLFDARQKEGQSAIEFREELLSLIGEADGINIGVNDLICMMLQTGLSDPSLQRELGAVRNPTLAEKIEGFEQARRTTATSAFGNAASRNPSSSSRRNSGQNGHPANRPNPPCRMGERDQCLTLRGKCFRCAKTDHLLHQCSYPEGVKCNLCGTVGHVTPACGRRQVAQMAQQNQPLSPPSSTQPPQQLAIAYDGGSHFSADGASSAWPLPSSASFTISSSTRAGVFYTPSNRPTPEMPL